MIHSYFVTSCTGLVDVDPNFIMRNHITSAHIVLHSFLRFLLLPALCVCVNIVRHCSSPIALETPHISFFLLSVAVHIYIYLYTAVVSTAFYTLPQNFPWFLSHFFSTLLICERFVFAFLSRNRSAISNTHSINIHDCK